ncbi:MAG: DoxX family membrane protein [Chitinophagaceae bacterium]
MKKKILFGVSILSGLMLINGGLNVFFQYMPQPEGMPERFNQMMYAFMQAGWIFPLLAITEIIGGALFITNKFRALGAIIILPAMIGAVLTHIVLAPSGLPIPLIILGINIWAIVDNWHKYLPMIK